MFYEGVAEAEGFEPTFANILVIPKSQPGMGVDAINAI